MAKPEQITQMKYGRIKKSTGITVPSFFILPDAPKDGIVINLPEMRLYYYPKDRFEVITEPIADGRILPVHPHRRTAGDCRIEKDDHKVVTEIKHKQLGVIDNLILRTDDLFLPFGTSRGHIGIIHDCRNRK